MRTRSLPTLGAVLAAVLLHAARAAADPLPGEPPPQPPPGAQPIAPGPEPLEPRDGQPPAPGHRPTEAPPRVNYWARGDARPFFAATIDVGYLYFRPRGSFGWGKPFWSWVGIDANPQISASFFGAYAGLRLSLPLFELRGGPRYVVSFPLRYLQPEADYGRLDLEQRGGSRAKYLAWEAELSTALPLGPGSVLLQGQGSYLTRIPQGLFVYEETLRVVTKPPWIWRVRAGYAVRLGVEGKLSVGGVADVIGVPERDALIVRAGAIASVALSNQVEAIGTLVIPLISPDTIGIRGGDFGQLGVRYRWASGMSRQQVQRFIEPIEQ